MPPNLKIIAQEILMCGLKSMPVAGKAFEVIEAVQMRHAMLEHGERLEEIERQMSRMDLRLRNLVEEEIRTTLERLGEPALDGPTLTAEIRNLRSIQQQGWDPRCSRVCCGTALTGTSSRAARSTTVGCWRRRPLSTPMESTC